MRELKSNGNPHAAVRSFLRRGIRRTSKLLEARPLTDEAVHDVRRKLKKLRAVARLVRTGMGRARYRQLSRCLRESGQPLSELRDSKVLLSTWHGLCRQSRVGSELRETLLAVFEARLHEARSHVLETPRVVSLVTNRLRRARKLIDQWTSPRAHRQTLADGLNRAYSRGESAARRAFVECTDANLHELRKRVKDLHHVCEFIVNAGHGNIRPLIQRTRLLGDLLGEDRDLAMLQKAMAGRHLSQLSGARSRIRRLTVGRRKRLQSEGLQLSRRIYSDSVGEQLRTYFRG